MRTGTSIKVIAMSLLCFPLGYLYWFRCNRGREAGAYAVSLAVLTAAIVVGTYMDVAIVFRSRSALVPLGLFGSLLTLLFLTTRSRDPGATGRAVVTGLLFTTALAMVVALAALTQLLHGTFVTRWSLPVYLSMVSWVAIVVYLLIRYPTDAIRNR